MESVIVSLSEALADAVARAQHAVVAVDGGARLVSAGIVWAPGIVVTASHTVARERTLELILEGGQRVKASVAGSDPGVDVAVLRSESLDLAPLPRGDADTARTGSLVLVVGRSGDANATATSGIISTTGGQWHTWRGGRIDRLIRLDARLYPGGSGAATVGPDGGLLGIATAGITRTLPVLVPNATVDRVVREVLETGRVRRSYLGVGIQPVRLPNGVGLIVLNTEPDGPAARGGLLVGDVLLEAGDVRLQEPGDLQAALSAVQPGASLNLRVWRAGQETQLAIEVGDRPGRS